MALITAMAPVVRLPALPLRTRGLFADVIPMVDTTVNGVNRLSFGARYWAPSIVASLEPVAFDCDNDEGPYEPAITFDGSGEATNVDPWTATAGVTCSTIPLDGDESLADIALDEVRMALSATLARAATSTAVTTVNLSDAAVDAGDWGDVGDALEALEASMATLIGNRRGYIIMPVSALAKAVDANAVRIAGDLLETPSGHLVVADAGAAVDKIYGVGQIGWSVVDPRLIDENGHLNLTRDTVTFLAQAEGIVVFNQATVASVGYEAPVEGS